MDEPIRRLEFETMLLTRHSDLFNAQARRASRRLDRSAYVLLSRIELDGPMSIGQLADAFGLDSSTLNRQTAAMLRAGVVERIPDPEGGIARKFSITAEGRERLLDDRRRNHASLARILDDWEPEEVADFVAMVHRFNEGIERLEGRPWPRP
ncbi:DNA-binding transcriptional regulator, MarR family [Streptomyces zhaozhouensis]|uniref:DNA-binding transcriptional regulator, MarR family n=1 Tax=Streptomyces zhaozhouensis TaxID=1300267 RepID=A0A286DPF3_9ACTN|nr:MarR family transcriptional regulator [Streptomyces zhaozhouensis]SOD60493.1 DNA-binding transcriptional regulator, MarR family [Streptomyces zhaozhouensis]